MSVRDPAQKKPSRGEPSPPQPASAPTVREDSAPGLTASGEKTFDPYKFQTNTMPPGLRADLIAAGLPRADPQRIDDTLPPSALGPPAAVPQRVRGNAPRNVHRSEPAQGARSRSRARLGWVVGLGVALVAASLVALFGVSHAPSAAEHRKGPRASAPVPKVAPARRVDPGKPGNEVSSAALAASRIPIDTRTPSSTRLAASAREPTRPPAPSLRASEPLGAETAPSASTRANPFDKPFKPPAE